MMLTGTVEDGTPLSPSETAREPRMMHLVAWFDGWAMGLGVGRNPGHFPRRLTLSEATSWREGHAAGRRERATA